MEPGSSILCKKRKLRKCNFTHLKFATKRPKALFIAAAILIAPTVFYLKSKFLDLNKHPSYKRIFSLFRFPGNFSMSKRGLWHIETGLISVYQDDFWEGSGGSNKDDDSVDKGIQRNFNSGSKECSRKNLEYF
jgi:hypothetical protein